MLAASLLAIPASASADAGFRASAVSASAVKSKTITDTFFVSYDKYNSSIKKCLVVTAYGELKYTITDYPIADTHIGQRHYTGFSVNPQMYELKAMTKCKGGATQKLSAATLSQGWSHVKCSLNANLSVAVPWGDRGRRVGLSAVAVTGGDSGTIRYAPKVCAAH